MITPWPHVHCSTGHQDIVTNQFVGHITFLEKADGEKIRERHSLENFCITVLSILCCLVSFAPADPLNPRITNPETAWLTFASLAVWVLKAELALNTNDFI